MNKAFLWRKDSYGSKERFGLATTLLCRQDWQDWYPSVTPVLLAATLALLLHIKDSSIFLPRKVWKWMWRITSSNATYASKQSIVILILWGCSIPYPYLRISERSVHGLYWRTAKIQRLQWHISCGGQIDQVCSLHTSETPIHCNHHSIVILG